MGIVIQVLNKHIQFIRSNVIAAILILAVFGVVLVSSYNNHVIAHALGYLFAVWLCAFISDLVVLMRPYAMIGFPVRKPLNKELPMILICTLLGFVFLAVRYYSSWDTMPGKIKLVFIPLILFTFPVVLAIVYLFVYKYKIRELGVNLNYWYLPALVMLVFGAITLTIAPANSHWQAELKEEGLAGMLFTGMITAALPEEFSRMLIQTRLSKALKSTGLGIVIASILWAMMHVPTFSQDYKKVGFMPGIVGAIRIIPLGLLWGYMTHRTKSIIPSIIVHGLNLWGLQWM